MSQNNLNHLIQNAVGRLNHKDPQYPPDIAFIKADRHRLQSYLDDHTKIIRCMDRGTPTYKQRFIHFEMKQGDADRMLHKELKAKERLLSHKDPFMINDVRVN